jgi:UDPglucose--hexose-1-phosphate uridylyltransferase
MIIVMHDEESSLTELRLDPVTKEWVIIAPERAGRPHDHSECRRTISEPTFAKDCPFCPGNEGMTPPEVAVYRKKDISMWVVRVVPNMYPVLEGEGSSEKRLVDDHFVSIGGFGAHEVVIESPVHNQSLKGMSHNEVEFVLRAYHDRYVDLSKKPGVKLVVIFRNQGTTAGTSIVHPHSQIVAVPIVSADVTSRCIVASEHYRKTGRCLYCDINEWELLSGKRIVSETDRFLVFNPCASRYPFETCISPKNHNASFGKIDSDEIRELAIILRRVIRTIDLALHNPDFNYVFHTAPVDYDTSPHLHWYVQIVPRIWTEGGFEIGSGIHVNTSSPEHVCELLKKTSLEQGQ